MPPNSALFYSGFVEIPGLLGNTISMDEVIGVTSKITQRRSIGKSVGCFQRHLFICLFVCQHDNFRTSKHRMMKLVGGCIVQNSRPSLNLEVIAPGICTPKNVALGYDIGKISAGCLV